MNNLPTLEVGIRNFRSYEVNPQEDSGMFTFRFERGVNLLKGSSGVGKSTVFMAISWCLFKKPGTGNTPLYGKSTGSDRDTVVILSLPIEGIVIKRVSPKTILTVTLPSQEVLENEEAQIFINSRFGREHVWRTCNYVSQGTINHLMSGELTDTQRWEVLYTLAFETKDNDQNQVSIDGLKNKIRTELEESDRKLRSVVETTSTSRERLRGLENQRTEYSVEIDNLPGKDHPAIHAPKEDFNTLYYEMRRVADTRVTSEEVVRANEEISALKIVTRSKTSEITRLEEALRILESSRLTEERTLRQDLLLYLSKKTNLETSLQVASKDLQRTERLHLWLDSVFTSFPITRVPLENLPDRVERLQRFLSRLLWLKTRNYRFITRDDALIIVQSAGETLEYARRREALQRAVTEGEERVFRLEPSLRGEGFDERVSLQPWGGLLERLQKAVEPGVERQVVECPCCTEQVVVRYTPREILSVTKYGSDLVDRERYRHMKLFDRNLILSVRKRDEALHQLNMLNITQVSVDIRDTGMTLEEIFAQRQDVGEWDAVPSTLRKICLDSLRSEGGPPNDKILHTLVEFTSGDDVPIDALETRVAVITDELYSLLSCISETKSSLEMIDERYRQETRDTYARISELFPQVVDAQSKLSKLEEAQTERQTKREWWDKLEKMEVTDKEQLKILYTSRKELERLETSQRTLQASHQEEITALGLLEFDMSRLVTRRELLSELQADLESVESAVLQNCVDRISSQTNQFLENAFDGPVVVNLVTEKEARGGKTKKHAVGITVKSGKTGTTNLVERSLDGFSGGETDRISLGFSNAITTFSSFPLLMLDECISSLDTETKDKVIRALRQQAKLTNKTIVLVCHDAVEGLFDHVCEVG